MGFPALSCDSSAPCQLRRRESLDDAHRLFGPAAVSAPHECQSLQRQSFPQYLSWPILCDSHRQRQTLRRLFVLVAREMRFVVQSDTGRRSRSEEVIAEPVSRQQAITRIGVRFDRNRRYPAISNSWGILRAS